MKQKKLKLDEITLDCRDLTIIIANVDNKSCMQIISSEVGIFDKNSIFFLLCEMYGYSDSVDNFKIISPYIEYLDLKKASIYATYLVKENNDTITLSNCIIELTTELIKELHEKTNEIEASIRDDEYILTYEKRLKWN